MKVYIAGPMRGLPNLNFEAFDAAAARWKAMGHQPFNPAETSRPLGYPTNGECPIALRHLILVDVLSIYHADAIALLPGWEKSRGATLEVALAQVLELPIYCALDMKPLNVINRPWARAAY